MQLNFDQGTILATGPGLPTQILQQAGALYDRRVRRLRAPAFRYGELREALRDRGVAHEDDVFQAAIGVFRTPNRQSLRPYQEGALIGWSAANRKGVVVLPTGSGKTRVALAAIRACGLPTLCIVPTRALLHQWKEALSSAGVPGVGQLGDGRRDVRPITVATSDSARIHMGRIGNRFRLLIVDEVHHFGNRLKDEALEMSIAEFRLGLTATPPGDPGQRARLEDLVGPIVFRRGILDLAGRWLADLNLVVLRLKLSERERSEWERERRIFSTVWRDFSANSPDGSWAAFVRAARRSVSGRAALEAWRRARSLLVLTSAKVDQVGALLERHRQSRVLIFTADNRSAYHLARTFLIMPITCHIRAKEREEALDNFRSGRIRALVSARVLNEGLDVPEADTGIVVSGTQGEREYTQRIGRLLRPAQGKTATLYELVTERTTEVHQSRRRRRAFEDPT